MSHTLTVLVTPSKHVILEVHNDHDDELIREQLAALKRVLDNLFPSEVEAALDRE